MNHQTLKALAYAVFENNQSAKNAAIYPGLWQLNGATLPGAPAFRQQRSDFSSCGYNVPRIIGVTSEDAVENAVVQTAIARLQLGGRRDAIHVVAHGAQLQQLYSA